jgi:hypothetical protein
LAEAATLKASARQGTGVLPLNTMLSATAMAPTSSVACLVTRTRGSSPCRA